MGALRRVSCWHVNGGNEGWVGNAPPSGARAGDRFALALISLALDEVDATQLLGGVAALGSVASRGCWVTVASARVSVETAASSEPLYGMGVSSVDSSAGGASSESKAAAATLPTIVAPQLPADGASCTTSNRFVRSTLVRMVSIERSERPRVDEIDLEPLARQHLRSLLGTNPHQLRRDHGGVAPFENQCGLTQYGRSLPRINVALEIEHRLVLEVQRPNSAFAELVECRASDSGARSGRIARCQTAMMSDQHGSACSAATTSGRRSSTRR